MQPITNIFTDCTDMVNHLRADLAEAKHHIYFQFFKFEADELGRQIGDLLIQRAKEGVDVRVIYDAVACWYVPRRFFRHLQREVALRYWHSIAYSPIMVFPSTSETTAR